MVLLPFDTLGSRKARIEILVNANSYPQAPQALVGYIRTLIPVDLWITICLIKHIDTSDAIDFLVYQMGEEPKKIETT